MRMILLCLSLISTAATARGTNSDDICALRPDLCDAAKPVVKAARTLARKPASAPVLRKVAAFARRSITCRPERVAITAANAQDPICGSAASASSSGATRDPASVALPQSAPDFNSYLQANSRNPALTRRIDGYQSAFRETARPATFVAPEVEGSGVREGAASTAQARNNN